MGIYSKEEESSSLVKRLGVRLEIVKNGGENESKDCVANELSQSERGVAGESAEASP